MSVYETQAKTILRKHKRIDSWFVARYSMNFYRGCTHNCAYCDGRAEGYYVGGEFGKDITIKVNTIDILKKELNPAKKRVPLIPGFIMLGGGVSDSYQPIEKKYEIGRNALKLISEYNYPVQILTKSVLVERDIDILLEINKKRRAIVSFSFSSADDEISRIFEPGVPLPSRRLETIKLLKSHGIPCGMFLMPVIPHVTDSKYQIENTLKKAKEAGIDFVIFSGMTLKQGAQQNYFLNVVRNDFPDKEKDILDIYPGNEWGQATPAYYETLGKRFNSMLSRYDIPQRIPAKFFKDILNDTDRVVVILEQLDFLLKSRGEKSPYGYAAYSITQLKEPVSAIRNNLLQLKGVGKFTERIIHEIIDTGTSSYYEKILYSK